MGAHLKEFIGALTTLELGVGGLDEFFLMMGHRMHVYLGFRRFSYF